MRAWQMPLYGVDSNVRPMISNFRHELRKIVQAQDDIEATAISYPLAEKLKNEPDAIDAVPIILELMEQHPTFDFGVPGPLVHFVERFYQHGYEDMLCVSFTRRPALHTVMMMHRLINGSTGEMKRKYIEILGTALSRPEIEQVVRNCADHYYRYHTQKT